MTLFIKKAGKGYPLALFHGWAFTHAVWQPLVDVLAEHFSLYLVDLPGFGQSPNMSWVTFQDQLYDHLPPAFAVLGWSLGGLYAMRLACDNKQISHLIAVAASPCFLQQEQWPGIKSEVLTSFYQNVQRDPLNTIAAFIELQQGKNKIQHPELLQYQADWVGLKQGLCDLKTWDLRVPLKGYSNPACFIFGRLDAITPIKTMTTMQSHYPQFHYRVFPKAAHMPFLSHQAEFLAILREFLR